MPTNLYGAVWRTFFRRPLIFSSLTLLFPVLVSLLTGLLTSCSTLQKNSQLYQCNQVTHVRHGMDFHPPLSLTTGDATSWNWEEIAEGISYTNYTANRAPLRWHLVSIDLHCPNMVPLAYPTAQHMDSQGKFNGKTTYQFLQETELQDSPLLVTVNATPFKTPLTWLSPKRQITGLYIHQGQILSPPLSRYSAICLWPQEHTLRAAIIRDQTTYPPETELALGGFFTIIQEGEIQDFPACSLDSRTALGITKDERYLLILYIEGENKKESLGLTYEETALILEAAGAWNALQMDGGSSAALSIKGKEITGKKHRRAANILGFALTFH